MINLCSCAGSEASTTLPKGKIAHYSKVVISGLSK